VSTSGQDGDAVGEATVGTRWGPRGGRDGGAERLSECGTGGCRARRGRSGCRDAARGVAVGTRRRRQSGAARAGRGSCRDTRRAVPTAALSRTVGVARRAAADKWDPLSAISELKFTLK
jgi:hypothetical protein